MNKKLYMKPSTNVKEIKEKETILDGSGNGLTEQQDGTVTQTGVKTTTNSVDGSSSLSKHFSIWQ